MNYKIDIKHSRQVVASQDKKITIPDKSCKKGYFTKDSIVSLYIGSHLKDATNVNPLTYFNYVDTSSGINLKGTY